MIYRDFCRNPTRSRYGRPFIELVEILAISVPISIMIMLLAHKCNSDVIIV